MIDRGNEEEWIEKAKHGDQTSFAHLFQLHYPFLYKYLLKTAMDGNLAEDLAQETMLKAYDQIKRYDGSSKFSSWLITIATRLFIDYLRKKQRERRWFRGESENMSRQFKWQLQHQGIEWTDVMEALAELGPELRIPLLLKHYYGYTYEEISHITGLKTGTVKSRVHTAAEKLRKELTNDGE